MVGGTMLKYYEEQDYPIVKYDSYKKIGSMNEVNQADVIFVCVPTPYLKGFGYSLKEVHNALSQIKPGKKVVLRSTVLPLTTKKLQEQYYNLKLFFNPEFLTEATAQFNFENPILQVVGYADKELHFYTQGIINVLPKGKYQIICDSDKAESIKMARNVLSATRVIILNEIYDILHKKGIDYEQIREGLIALAEVPSLHLDVIHKGGRGAGGKCLEKELSAFTEFGKLSNRPSKIIELANEINKKLLKKYPKDDSPSS